jgi:phytoene dehydrogenase-like protein
MRRAVVIGPGPNGLAAAVTLARARVEVEVVEAHAEVGGGTRTAELTLPGFRHDACSAIHPLARASPASTTSTSTGSSRRPPALTRSTTGRQ